MLLTDENITVITLYIYYKSPFDINKNHIP